jgi:hypothetical protein
MFSGLDDQHFLYRAELTATGIAPDSFFNYTGFPFSFLSETVSAQNYGMGLHGKEELYTGCEEFHCIFRKQ